MKVTNYNCVGMCIEKYCNNKYTEFYNIKINNMNIQLCFCKQHAEEYVTAMIKFTE